VALKTARALESQGYRIGLYTSPHLTSFRERIQIDSTMISEDQVVSQAKRIFEVLDREKAQAGSFFDIITILAFIHFSEN